MNKRNLQINQHIDTVPDEPVSTDLIEIEYDLVKIMKESNKHMNNQLWNNVLEGNYSTNINLELINKKDINQKPILFYLLNKEPNYHLLNKNYENFMSYLITNSNMDEVLDLIFDNIIECVNENVYLCYNIKNKKINSKNKKIFQCTKLTLHGINLDLNPKLYNIKNYKNKDKLSYSLLLKTLLIPRYNSNYLKLYIFDQIKDKDCNFFELTKKLYRYGAEALFEKLINLNNYFEIVNVRDFNEVIEWDLINKKHFNIIFNNETYKNYIINSNSDIRIDLFFKYLNYIIFDNFTNKNCSIFFHFSNTEKVMIKKLFFEKFNCPSDDLLKKLDNCKILNIFESEDIITIINVRLNLQIKENSTDHKYNEVISDFFDKNLIKRITTNDGRKKLSNLISNNFKSLMKYLKFSRLKNLIKICDFTNDQYIQIIRYNINKSIECTKKIVFDTFNLGRFTVNNQGFNLFSEEVLLRELPKYDNKILNDVICKPILEKILNERKNITVTFKKVVRNYINKYIFDVHCTSLVPKLFKLPNGLVHENNFYIEMKSINNLFYQRKDSYDIIEFYDNRKGRRNIFQNYCQDLYEKINVFENYDMIINVKKNERLYDTSMRDQSYYRRINLIICSFNYAVVSISLQHYIDGVTYFRETLLYQLHNLIEWIGIDEKVIESYFKKHIFDKINSPVKNLIKQLGIENEFISDIKYITKERLNLNEKLNKGHITKNEFLVKEKNKYLSSKLPNDVIDNIISFLAPHEVKEYKEAEIIFDKNNDNKIKLKREMLNSSLLEEPKGKLTDNIENCMKFFYNI